MVLFDPCVSARLQCFLNMFSGTVIVHKAHKPKLMVVNRYNLYVFFRWVCFACGWVHCSQLMQWNDHLMQELKRRRVNISNNKRYYQKRQLKETLYNSTSKQM